MLRAELKVVEGRQQGKAIPLTVRKFLIGREQDCQLRPNSELVSRHHCVFSIDDYTVRLRDLGSTNGTFVNGDRIQGQVLLNHGDRIQIGKVAFQLVIHQPAPVAQGSDADVLSYHPEPNPHVADPNQSAAETSLNFSDTRHDVPAPVEGDTTIVGAPPAAVPGAVPQMQPYPPGYPAVPPGYAPVPPGYMPVPPGYVPMPVGYMPVPPGYAPMAPPEVAPPPTSAASRARIVPAPPLMLPDPEETGAREPAPPPPAPEGAAQAEEKKEPVAKNPSLAAEDIIRSRMQRRPGGA